MSDNQSRIQLENFMSIQDFWILCRSHYRWFVASVAVALMIAVYYLSTTADVYSREAAVMVKMETTRGTVTQSASGNDFNNMELVQQQTNVPNVLRQYKSLALLTDVVCRLDSLKDEDEAKRAAQSLQRALSVSLDDEQSTIINLKYQDESPERAEKVLNTIINVYNDRWINDKRLMANSTARFIDDRLLLIDKELSHVDDSISTFKARHEITNLEQASGLYLQQQTESEAEILKLSNQMHMAQYILDILNDAKSRYKLLPVHTGLASGEAGEQIAQYNALLLKLKNSLEGTSTQNPIIIRQEDQLKEIRQNIIASVSNYIKTLQIQIGTMEGYNADVKEKVVSSPEQAKRLLAVERDQKVKESLNTSVRSKIDIESRTQIPIVGEIPYYGEEKKRKKLRNLFESKKKRYEPTPLVVQPDCQDHINEAFRILRSSLEFMSDTRQHKNVYLITSMFPGSGKTFISMNLALTLAIKHRHVLFIDGDLRRATATCTFGNTQTGLADYLGEKVESIDQLIYRHGEYPSLNILPVGTTPPNPTELLSSPRMRQLIEEMRPKYDFIIIDCPMTETLADASILGHHVDRTLYIVRAGLFQCNQVSLLDSYVESGKYKNLSIVLNAVKPLGQYGYKYGYYYDYKY